uniref:Immunoglobulin domain-containing protein n=1 Tax=Chelonoidis abingdonii TaxID=106734 RepID=A0A8C0H0G5_CHEAB
GSQSSGCSMIPHDSQFLSLALSLAGCWAVTGPGTAHGQLGGSVSVQCQYGAGYEAYPKFWCRRKVVLCFNHLIFETMGSEAEETWGRVSIRDNHTQRVITVTLENLTLADAGTYLCGVARIGFPNPRDSVKVIISPAGPFDPKPPYMTVVSMVVNMETSSLFLTDQEHRQQNSFAP